MAAPIGAAAPPLIPPGAAARLLVTVAVFVAALALPPGPHPDVAGAAAPAATRAACARYDGLFRANGLPVQTFRAIAWRESGCNPRSFVIDSDDAGGGLLGINLKGRLAGTWRRWCGATLANITSAAVNVRCAGVAYRKRGLAPWR
jgi:hypothetical protein